MALFSRKVATRAAAPAPEFQPVSCPAFSRLVRDYSEEQKYRILDLGGARASNVAFFNQYRCKLYIGDTVSTLMELQAELDQDDESPEFDMKAVLELGDLSSQDLILCWDIFNYLDKRLLTPVSTALAEILSDTGCMHAFIHTHKEMPAEPGIYQIESHERMNVAYRNPGQVPAPRYAQRELERLMPGLKVKQSHLLQSGVQEYLLVRQ